MNGRTDRTSAERIYGCAVAAVSCLGLVLLCAAPSSAQSSAKTPTHASASAAKAPATRAKSGGGNHEGITVHGHWVIEVKNPDGKVAARREFENTLQNTGADLLVGLLYGQFSAGFWDVRVSYASNNPGSGPCSPVIGCDIQMPGIPAGAPIYCTGGYQPPPPLSAIPSAACSDNLNTSIVPPSGGGVSNSLQLSGSVVSTSGGTINAVSTELLPCASSTTSSLPTLDPASPASCLSATLPSGATYAPVVFTSAVLSPSINGIQAGQTISVTVAISFSPGS